MKLVADPEPVLESARGRLGSMRPGLRGGALEWLDQWAQLIEDRDVGGLIVVMLGTTQHDIDMRSVSPFTGLLSSEEREEVLARSSTTPAQWAAMSRLDRITSDRHAFDRDSHGCLPTRADSFGQHPLGIQSTEVAVEGVGRLNDRSCDAEGAEN